MLAGAFAVYLEPWHADIFEFLDLRKNHGKVWRADSLFMEMNIFSCFACCVQYQIYLLRTAVI